MPTTLRLHELRRYAHAVRGLPDATVDQVISAERQADRPRIASGILEREAGVAGDDRQRTVFGQRGDDVLCDAIREIVLLGIVAEIVERQDRDGRPAAPLDRSSGHPLNGGWRHVQTWSSFIWTRDANRLNVTNKANPFARIGLDQDLALAGVTDGLACRGDPRAERRFRNNASLPY